MKSQSQSETAQDIQFFSPALRLFIIGFLFIAAFGIRVYHINEPPLDFLSRQYRSAFIARSYYYKAVPTIPQWKKEVAKCNEQMAGILEPPIMEVLASIAYRLLGGEHLAVPRLLSSMFWLAGGVFLYLLASKTVSAEGALLSTGFYLFLPFAIRASRSFQPDSLMVMMLILSVYTMFQYYQRSSILRLFIAAAVSGLAILIKPPCLLPIFMVFICLAFYTHGFWRALTRPSSVLFCFAALLPSLVYYGWAIFITGSLQSQAQGSFMPYLMLHSFFWKGWLRLVGAVLGFAPVTAGLIGLVMLPQGPPRRLGLGMWLGYILFGLVFTYHIHTHDYYQLMFIPIVAYSLAPVGYALSAHITRTSAGRAPRVFLVGIIVTSVLLVIYHVKRQLFHPYYDTQVKIAQEIGDAVQHSSKTVFLTPNYGTIIKYHGHLSGNYWPNQGDFRGEILRGKRVLGAEERFNTHYLKGSPEYFIVTDYRELQRQPDLRKFLTQNFPVLVNNRNYLIFNLKRKL